MSPADAQRRDVHDKVGNSATRLDNNHTLVALTSLQDPTQDDANDQVVKKDVLVLEATEAGGLHHGLQLIATSIWAEGSYRAIPQPSVYGEKSSSPLAAEGSDVLRTGDAGVDDELAGNALVQAARKSR